MLKTSKKRALCSQYTSSMQLALSGFETPFPNQLNASNRWVVISKQMTGDELVNRFNKPNVPIATGRPALNPRALIGEGIIQHMLNLDDRETVARINENMYPAGRDRYCNNFGQQTR